MLSWTIKICYRKIKLRQHLGNLQTHVPTKIPSADEFIGSPLVTQQYVGSDISINTWFVVPPGEIWQLYGCSIQITDPAQADHAMQVYIGTLEEANAGTFGYGQMIYDGYVAAGQAKYTRAGLEATGPFGLNLYPMLLRENEYVKIATSQDEQA